MSTENDLRPEYDLSELEIAGRELYANRYTEGIKTVIDEVEYIRLEPDVAKVFKASEAINQALRLVIKMSETVKVETS